MTQFYHWLGRDAEPHHEPLAEGMLFVAPVIDCTDMQAEYE